MLKENYGFTGWPLSWNIIFRPMLYFLVCRKTGKCRKLTPYHPGSPMKTGLPTTWLDSIQSGRQTSGEQLRTRVEAFIEIMQRHRAAKKIK